MLMDKKNTKKLIMLKKRIEHYELLRKELIYKNHELEIELDKINEKLEKLWAEFRTVYLSKMSKNFININTDPETTNRVKEN